MELPRYLDKYNWRPSDPSEECVRFVGVEGFEHEGKPYEDFLCLYPWLKNFYTKREIDISPYELLNSIRQNWWLPLGSCFLYGILIVAGKAYFANRKPLDWRNALILWNLSLAAFSLCGFLKFAPVVLHIMINYSWKEVLCYDPFLLYGQTGAKLWIILFSYSKIVELFDTLFIIVHKKPLILLHWYHHLSVLLVTWYLTATLAPAGAFVIIVNLFVHSIMYFYYFLMAAKIKPKWYKAKYITIIQIAQMVVGLYLSVAGFYLNFINQPHCETTLYHGLPFLVMYASYFLLFSKFFFNRYMSKPSKNTKKQGEKKIQ